MTLKELNYNTNQNFKSKKDVTNKLQEITLYLSSHNKNYDRKQYSEILDLYEIAIYLNNNN